MIQEMTGLLSEREFKKKKKKKQKKKIKKQRIIIFCWPETAQCSNKLTDVASPVLNSCSAAQ